MAELQFNYKPMQDNPTHFTMTWWEVLELSFTFLYILEMTLKMIVLGPSRYWQSWRNRFDGFISMSSLVSEAILITPWIANEPGFIRFIMLARLLRSLRLLSDIPEFAVIFSSFFQLVPIFSRLVGHILYNRQTQFY